MCVGEDSRAQTSTLLRFCVQNPGILRPAHRERRRGRAVDVLIDDSVSSDLSEVARCDRDALGAAVFSNLVATDVGPSEAFML